MIHVITGGSGSGKSSYGEDWILEKAKGDLPLLYLATMIPQGEEGRQRVERHRRLREGKGFSTIECPRQLAKLSFPKNRGILLECVSNLAANTWYEEKTGYLSEEETIRRIREDLYCLREHTPLLVVITNETAQDLLPSCEEMQIYQRILGRVNQYLGGLAEKVTEVAAGIPIPVKM
ncbi:bifunctional adenosylcobinamide kinase/adenosylcobinamide-phosphate guanylyltransferase [Suipraeoptans intestinalis]|uniref:bifunctional adenosylcobinamide kinase/adenosylcobinamide-phosphate guanylyltransferase n=1 Tax=Suipraeoptans intestinalis TaxID=2606628 RepID=UPI002A76006B|nr:bifunctional adenosylcobinamide kinase/adenosylcobinamide-phosphate guanylyltransferase [Suipraeoptans intestinalis]MDY3121689.1 bifunctional adenosylcobinamide kinase/adenosylcobinamide-phosphate guanylyltransferase [Suipraeoptans intestinalis]